MDLINLVVSPILVLLSAVMIGIGVVILVKTYTRLKNRKE